MKNYNSRVKSLMKFHKDFAKLVIKGFEVGLDNEDNLNGKHYQTLMFLYQIGPTTMNDLSTRVMLQKGSFTPVANKLISIGYIKKERSLEDKRVYYLELTEKGRSFIIEFREKHHAYVEDKFSNLTVEERDRYFELLNELRVLNEKMT